MFLPLYALLLGVVPGPGTPPPGTTYNGRQNELHVRIPRVEADVVIDGRLSEAVWQQAALLTGFSQFSPQDGIPASDSTEVLVWYSPTAIHFGIRAFERHGQPIATLADRDRIDSDDQIQLLLGTFNDGRQATVFGVNPLGVQMDGTILETNQARSTSFMSQAQSRDPADLSQDFVFTSKGHVTEYGYEIEVRIPFKSLRYQPTTEQNWSLNIVRKVQHSGFEDSWAPARRANSSFLSQSGTLDGLVELRRGLVLDINPVVTQRTSGVQRDPRNPGTGWKYLRADPEVGGNVRWGITNNLTLNATVNPDFSQVESDAGQLNFDPRSAIFFPEKRPFFLEGMDDFSTPNNLVYTRAIQQPVAATKLTGKLAGTSLAVLSAVDDRVTSFDYAPALGRRGHNPLYNIARIQRDVGDKSRIGGLYTSKIDGEYSSHLADIDGRLVFGKLYALAFQGAASRTDYGNTVSTSPLWNLTFSRNGKHFDFRYAMSGIDTGFVAANGFISRPGLIHSTIDHSFTFLGARGALLESFIFNPFYDNTWKYDHFMHQRDAIEKKLHFNTQYVLRGGWSGGFSWIVESFGYDSDLFQGVFVQRHTASGIDTIPFTGTARLPNIDWVLSLNTPRWQWLSLNALYLWGQDENFDEWASSDIVFSQLGALIRPTEKLRINPSWVYQSYGRMTTGRPMRVERISRLKTEYQIARPLFLRVIGEYRSFDRLALQDESRTNDPLLMPQPDGSLAVSAPLRRHNFRADWLVSYQPNPGTVFFAGYGNAYARASVDPLQLTERFRTEDLISQRFRTSDTFFVKLSYLFRM
jgi:hypothetical protein